MFQISSLHFIIGYITERYFNKASTKFKLKKNTMISLTNVIDKYKHEF